MSGSSRSEHNEEYAKVWNLNIKKSNIEEDNEMVNQDTILRTLDIEL